MRAKEKKALILVDLLNHFEFPDGERLLRNAMKIVPAVQRLKARAQQEKVPVIYVNDNFANWHWNANDIIRYCLRSESRGRDFVSGLTPNKSDFILLKPMHSVFYQTALDSLLRFLDVSSVVLAGISTNSCVVYSAHDAKMRGMPFVVPSDCCAARTAGEHRQALEHIQDISGADVLLSKSIRFR